MHMTAEQLVQELKDTVLELHFTRRHAEALEAENASLRARLAPAEEHGHTHES
ncbi:MULTISPECIES: hypothetical protein [unclassified Streptomyces]|uniref:hypothetical protein n=1 Tax=unclassified Streptomyces TaxID=2593676 RepID=UPI0036FAB816